MGYMTNGLTFNTLRGGNVARLPEFKNRRGEPAHSEPDGSDWSPAQWLQAVTGELGEYANVRKKFERGDFGNDDDGAKEFHLLASSELADVVIYLDLLAFRLGIDLGAAVMNKFNAVSRRVGSDIFIDAEDWHRRPLRVVEERAEEAMLNPHSDLSFTAGKVADVEVREVIRGGGA